MNSLTNPLVSIVMPVYNGEPFLRTAIDSILAQHYSNFEFIIVDDCSSDGSRTIIESYDDNRIQLIALEHNLGCGGATNVGFEAAKGEYIAKMDCDDYAYPQKLAKQVDYMERHASVGALGTHYKLVSGEDAPDSGRRVIIPTEDDVLKFRLMTAFPFCHPTMMFRRSVLRDNNISYNADLRLGEDLDLVVSLSSHTNFANLSSCLFGYRKHEQSITALEPEANARDKLSVITPYHKSKLSEEFMASEHYDIIVNTYFYGKWAEFKNTPTAFADAMFALANDYCSNNKNTNRKAIYGFCSELLWRGVIFKIKCRNPITLCKIIISRSGMFASLGYHFLKLTKRYI